MQFGVADATGASASRTFTFTVNAAPALGALTSSQWTVGQSGYNGAIPITGGTGASTLVSQSNLPPGLTAVLSGNSVVFTGTPTATGTFGSASITVQDATGATATAGHPTGCTRAACARMRPAATFESTSDDHDGRGGQSRLGAAHHFTSSSSMR